MKVIKTADFLSKESKKKGKWIQDADLDEGSFTDYCGGNVTQECINKGKKSRNKKTRRRAELAETFRDMAKKRKKKAQSEYENIAEMDNNEWTDNIPGGKGDDAYPAEFSKDQILAGIKVELEHTDDPILAAEIALDHLMESDKYYDYLAEMEDKFDKE